MSLQQHLEPNGPKRILALDGGGIRGALTLGYLTKIEALLRKQHDDDPDFRLCDYFDLIGGTSTGSIIASCLAIGMTVKDIKDMYFALGGKIFGDKHKWYEIFKLIKATYDAGPLDRELQQVFGNIKLGGKEILTGLCIVAKRADTNSIWPMINHPKGKYYDTAEGKNAEILLWKAVRASAAAPSYFIPQVIEVGGGMPTAAFVDGGVSMANNPALQLLMVATLKGFPFRWKSGAENLLLVSVGTGMSKPDRIPAQVTDNHLLNWAKEIPDMFMQDASAHNQIILQWLSKSPTAVEIDGEIGKLEDDLMTEAVNPQGLLSYLRYNVLLEEKSLFELNGKKYSKDQVNKLIDMSNPDSVEELFAIGSASADQMIENAHFPETFVVQKNSII